MFHNVFCIQPVHSHKYVTFAFIFCIKTITQMHFVYSILTFFYHPHHHQQHTKFCVLLPSNNIIYTNIVNSVSGANCLLFIPILCLLKCFQCAYGCVHMFFVVINICMGYGWWCRFWSIFESNIFAHIRNQKWNRL